MKHLILVLFFASTFSLVHAQSDKKVWTLRDCIDYAIANNLTLQRSNANVETSEVNALQAKMAMLPTLNANGSYGFNWGRSIDPGSNLFIERRIKSINMSVSSSLLLWNGFRLFYGMKQSEADLDAAQLDYIKSQNDLILNIITLYLSVIFNQELYLTADLQLKSSQEQLERTKKLEAAGSVPRSDVLNLEAQVATNELNLITRENAYNLSLLQLKQALQLPASTPMDVQVPALDLEQPAIEGSAEEIFEVATLNMPEMKSARIKQQSASYAFRSARGNYYPRISLNGSINTLFSDARENFTPTDTLLFAPRPIGYVGNTNETVFTVPTQVIGNRETIAMNTQFKDNLSRSLGINIQIPLFNGFATRATVQRAAISRKLADISYKETENTLRQSIETAYNDALAASKTYISSQKQVQARDEAYRIMKQRFEIGAANYVEYQVSENDLFQAKSDLLRAKYDLIFKKKVIDFYLGKSLEF